jgi:bacterioferritin (cytochrome b1)
MSRSGITRCQKVAEVWWRPEQLNRILQMELAAVIYYTHYSL